MLASCLTQGLNREPTSPALAVLQCVGIVHVEMSTLSRRPSTLTLSRHGLISAYASGACLYYKPVHRDTQQATANFYDSGTYSRPLPIFQTLISTNIIDKVRAELTSMSFSVRPHQRSGVMNTLHDHEFHRKREKDRQSKREAEERRLRYGDDAMYHSGSYHSRRHMSDESSWESGSRTSSGYASSSFRRASTSGHSTRSYSRTGYDDEPSRRDRSSSRLRAPPSSYRDPSRSSHSSHSDRYHFDRYDHGGFSRSHSSRSHSSHSRSDDDRSGYDIYRLARVSSYGRDHGSGGGLQRRGAVKHSLDHTWRVEYHRDDDGRMDHGAERGVRADVVKSGKPTFHYVRDQYEPHHLAVFEHTDRYY